MKSTPTHSHLSAPIAIGIVAAMLLALAPLSITLASTGGGEGSTNEYKLKAAFVYNFAKYTTWPKEAFAKKESPVVVTVVGRNPFGNILDATLKGKKVGVRPFSVKQVSQAAKVKTPHILFLGGLKAKERKALLQRLKGKPVLVIADEAGLAGNGAIAGFYLNGAKVRFEISAKAAKSAGLTISSQLLKLAKLVDSKQP